MSINITNENKSFLIRINEQVSQDLERHFYEIDRWASVIARQLSKNQRFDSLGVSNEFETLKKLCAEYDDAKDKLSNDIVIPAATEKWGKFANLSWSLNFTTCDVTVTYNGTVFQQKYESIAEVPDDVSDALKKLSIEIAAYTEIYDKVISQYPTIDTDSYKEFVKLKDDSEREYDERKMKVDAEYVSQYLAENSLAPEKCQWSLHYSTKKIDLFESVSAEYFGTTTTEAGT